MPTLDDDERIRKLEAKHARTTAALQRAKVRRRQNQRKLELRRDIIAGRMVRRRVALGKLSEHLFLRDIDEYTTRPQDRAAFGLPPLPTHEEPGRAQPGGED